jgi:lipopolysaccharide transport system permease protein
VKFRDVANVLPFLTQTWFFITPVFYPTSMIPESWRLVYGLNPMTGVVDGFRWAVLGSVSPPGLSSLISAGTMILLVIGGLYYFRYREDYFADEV